MACWGGVAGSSAVVLFEVLSSSTLIVSGRVFLWYFIELGALFRDNNSNNSSDLYGFCEAIQNACTDDDDDACS